MQSAAAAPQLATVGAASATSSSLHSRAAANLKPSSLPFGAHSARCALAHSSTNSKSHIMVARASTSEPAASQQLEGAAKEEDDGAQPAPVIDAVTRIPVAPPEWAAEQAEIRAREESERDGISIRRRPPAGPTEHAVGPFQFKIGGEGVMGDSRPRNILEEIVWSKAGEIEEMREKVPLVQLSKVVAAMPPTRDFLAALRHHSAATGLPALIAEVKKASPSRGVIQPDFDPVRIARAYEAGGAACLSVLTDAKFFQGSFENLSLIRPSVSLPLLCKEFVVDAYQLFKARVSGADAVLLIAAVLTDQDLRYMMKIAKALGLTTLIEVHSEREMDRVLSLDGVELIGINNRNLETFTVDIGNTARLLAGERGAAVRERGILVVGESGLFTPDDIAFIQSAGCSAVLVGESLVRENDPEAAIGKLFGKSIVLSQSSA